MGSGFSAELSAALETGDPRAVRAALVADSLNADTLLDRTGRPVLLEAAKRGNVDMLRVLVGVGHASVHTTSSCGHTPLMEAAIAGHVSAIDYLCQVGADGSAVDKMGFTALHHASMCGQTDVVRDLCSRGVLVCPESSQADTPLHLAARNGHLDAIRVLAEFGAKLHACNRAGETPTDLATACHKAAAAELIKELTALKPAGQRELAGPVRQISRSGVVATLMPSVPTAAAVAASAATGGASGGAGASAYDVPAGSAVTGMKTPMPAPTSPSFAPSGPPSPLLQWDTSKTVLKTNPLAAALQRADSLKIKK